MEFVEMSKIGNRVELYFKDKIEPIVISINDNTLIEECKLRDDGGYIITLRNGEVINIDPTQIIDDYMQLYPNA